jgi:hypothetical protein
LLTTYAPPCPGCLGRYSIDWIATNNVSTNSLALESYFIQNSILGLLTHNSTLDSQQILARDGSFVYDQGVWRGSIVGGTSVGGLDIGSVVSKFLAAPGNSAAGASTQAQVVQAMRDYMDAYEAWAASNFSNNGLKSTAVTKQDLMMTAVQNLYKGSYYPPEVACP